MLWYNALMGIYVYKCQGCDGTTEFLENYSNNDEHICPSCKGQMQRIFTPRFSYTGTETGSNHRPNRGKKK